MRKALLGFASIMTVAATSGLTTAPAMAADPDFVEDCRKQIETKIYAQANRAVLYAETDADGVDSEDIFLVDNDNSSSRFGFKGRGWINCLWYAGAQIELEAESNESSSVRFGQDLIGTGGGQQFEFNERIIDAYVGHKRFGLVTLGQGKHASDSTIKVDLSKTTVVSQVEQEDIGGDLFYGSGGAGFALLPIGGDPVRVDDLQDSYDGLGRADRVRYDTPTFAGFSLSTSLNDNEEWDVALRYAGEFGAFKVKAAGFYADSNQFIARSEPFENSFGGSISVLHASGLNATFSASQREWDPNGAGIGPVAAANVAGFEGRQYYGKLGYIFQQDLFPWQGWTAISGDVHYQEDDFSIVQEGVCGGNNDCSAMSYGLQLVHSPLDGVEIYAGGRVHDADITLIQTEEIFTVLSGFRVKL